MRIVCESCGTKYSISDEKVRGKLFKIRCKKCSHVIVVRGVEEAAEEQPSLPEPSSEGASTGMEWFYVVDGQQAGPISPEEIPAYVASGRIQADTYMWREGMDDWIHLSEVAEFGHLVDDAIGTSPSATTTGEHESGANGSGLGSHVFAGSGHVEDFPDYSDDGEATRVMAAGSEEPRSEEPARSSAFGGAEIAPPPGGRSSLSLAPASSPSTGRGLAGDLFQDSGAPRGSAKMAASAGLFSADVLSSSQTSPVSKAAAAAAAAADQDSSLVGARSENSVLFSLDSLTGGDGPSESGNGGMPVTEGSGLIDIKALAASQAVSSSSESRSSSGDHLALTPAVMPIGQRQSHTLLYVLIGAGALVIVGLVVAIVIVLGNRGETPTPTAETTTPPVAETGQPTTPVETTSPTEAVDPVATAPVDPLANTPAPAGPTMEQITATTRDSTTVAMHTSTRAEDAATDIGGRRPTSNGRDRERERERERTEETPTPEVATTETEEPERTGSGRREREEPASDDPVAQALARIRTDEEPERQETEETEPSREEETTEESPPRRDLPEQLSRSQVSQAVRRYQRRLAECRSQSSLPAGEVLAVDVEMTIQSNGRVASARSSSGDPAADCIVDVVRDMSFDEFSGDSMSFTYPVRIR